MSRLACCALIPVAVRYPHLLFRVLTLLARIIIFAGGHVMPLLWLGIAAEAVIIAVLAWLTVRELWPQPRLAASTS
jgi:hypothetical protein